MALHKQSQRHETQQPLIVILLLRIQSPPKRLLLRWRQIKKSTSTIGTAGSSQKIYFAIPYDL